MFFSREHHFLAEGTKTSLLFFANFNDYIKKCWALAKMWFLILLVLSIIPLRNHFILQFLMV